MVSEETKLLRRNMFPEWERELYANREPDFPDFYYHKSVERIVLSHALFWVMTKNFKNKVAKEKYGFVGTKDDLKALKDSICK